LRALLIDMGNTRVKWAYLQNGRMGRQRAAANARWRTGDYVRRVLAAPGQPDPRKLDRIVVSSVTGRDAARILVAAARKTGGPKPEFVTSRRRAGGITTAYLEPWRLGVDRFLAVIGAHHCVGARAVLVVNVGTAITLDLVTAEGRHRGGAIAPGPDLMIRSLLLQTSGIRRRAVGGNAGLRGLFARATRTAIGEGARYAVAALIDRGVDEARRLLGHKPEVLLTGGGSPAIGRLMRSKCRNVPDLVLRGLAVWAREAPMRRGLN
jgi:type III pantothenate kinase